MPHTIHHWDNDTKKHLFGLGVEAMIMSISGRTDTGGPYFSYDKNWINNIDIQELTEAVEDWSVVNDPSDVIAKAWDYILSKEEAIHEVVIGILNKARTGNSYWMFV